MMQIVVDVAPGFIRDQSAGIRSLTPVRSLIALILLASPAFAGEEPKIPTRFGCAVVRSLYGHYAKQGYTIDQMRAFLQSKGFSEARVAGAEKCLG